MNNEEAKFILGAYRPDGRDAADPQFAAALMQAERDPELRRWLENQRAFDRAVAGRLAALAPPPGLREAILAGGRASRPARRWWASPAWLGAAAAIALLALVGVQGLRPAGGGALAEFAALAAGELAAAHDSHEGFPAGLGELQARLAAATGPLSKTLSLDLEELRKQRCRTVRLGGREVFELCFNRDGTWYHLYVAPRGRLAPGAGAAMAARGDYAAAAWTDAQHVYALVASGGAPAIQRLI
jgi:anti-sigma factor RsiW